MDSHEPKSQFDRRRTPEFDPNDIDAYGIRLHFQLLEHKMDDIKEEIKDIKGFIRDNRKDFTERLDKMDARIWAIVLMTLGTLITAVASKFI